jgi:hypothetical protein
MAMVCLLPCLVAASQAMTGDERWNTSKFSKGNRNNDVKATFRGMGMTSLELFKGTVDVDVVLEVTCGGHGTFNFFCKGAMLKERSREASLIIYSNPGQASKVAFANMFDALLQQEGPNFKCTWRLVRVGDSTRAHNSTGIMAVTSPNLPGACPPSPFMLYL